MDFTKPNNSDHFSKKRCARWRAFFVCMLVLVLGILGLIAFAPLLLSTASARERIIALVNAQIAPAKLTVEDWSLDWFRTQTVTGMTYHDPKTETTAQVKQLSASSLWKLLPIGKVTVDLEVEHPNLTLPLPKPTPPKPAVVVKPAGPATKPTTQAPEIAQEVQDAPEKPVPFVLPAWDIALNLKVVNVRVTCPELSQPLIQEGNFTLSLPALDQAAQTMLTAKLLDATLALEATTAPVDQLLTQPIGLNALHQASTTLQAPWINLSAALAPTTTAPYPTATLNLNLDTEKAFALLRPLNLLPTALTSISGQFGIATKVTPLTPEQLHVACTVTSKELTCDYDGKTLRCAPNITTDLMVHPKNLLATEVRQLEVALPGINITGAGSLTNGTLSATLQTAPIWETFGTFIGDYPLQHPLTLSLTAKALAEQLTLQVKTKHNDALLGDLNLTIDALAPIAQKFKSLKLNSQWHLASLLAATAPLPQNITADGEFYLNLAATGAFTDLRSNLTFAYRNAKIRATSWNITEPSLLEGAATLTLKEKVLSLSELTLSSPLAMLNGGLTANLAPTLTADGKFAGKLTPEVLMKKWRVWGKDEKPVNLSGDIDYTIAAQKVDDALNLTLTAGAEAFTLLPQDAEAIPLPLDLTLALTHANTQTTLKQFAFTTDGLALTADGTYVADQGVLALKGMLTPDFDTLFATLPPLKQHHDTFVMSGKHERAFTFEAPITQGLPGIINYGKGSAEIAFDTVTVPGLDIPKGVVTLTLADGVAAVNGVVDVNGGSVYLQPRINITGTTPVLTWEPNGKVLNRVRLTQKLFNTALGAINPVLTDSADPEGYLSLTCESLHLPLDQAPLLSLDTRLTLQTESCSLRPNSSIKKVISTMLGKTAPLRMDDKAFSVTLKSGVLTTEPISVQVDDLRFSCQGSTNLATQSIDYAVTLPLHEKLLGRKLGKDIKEGETVTVPIRGTIKEPVIDIAPLTQVFSSVAVEKAKDKLSEKLEKALKKREAKRQKKGQSKKDSREEALEDALRGLFGN